MPYRAFIATALATIGMLYACGGSQSQIGAPGAMVEQHSARTQDLLYVSDSEWGRVYIYSYSQGKLLNTIQTASRAALGECVDASGNVFVTAQNASGNTSSIYEYAHGGTNAIASLTDPGQANGCAVDPTTGNLAVANTRDESNPYHQNAGDLAIYVKAQGSPNMYYAGAEFGGFIFCGYDKSGNLYLTASDEYHGYPDLVRFSSKDTTFERISLNIKIYLDPSVQVDGRYVLLSTVQAGGNPKLLYRLRVSGSEAIISHTTQLASKHNAYQGQVWVQRHTVVGISHDKGHHDVSLWRYPEGGNPRQNIEVKGPSQPFGVVVSTAGAI